MIPADQIACKFAQHLVDKDYTAAHALMCPDSQPQWPADRLRQDFEAMMDDQAPQGCHLVMEMEQWADKAPGDLGWVYVAISADVFSEAVTVVVCEHDGQSRIRQVEWGRP